MSNIMNNIKALCEKLVLKADELLEEAFEQGIDKEEVLVKTMTIKEVREVIKTTAKVHDNIFGSNIFSQVQEDLEDIDIDSELQKIERAKKCGIKSS